MRLTFKNLYGISLIIQGYIPPAKFQPGKHSNYTNDISGLLSMKIIGILLFGLLKMKAFLVDNSILKFF